jgi:hypothetical protein
MRTQFFPIHILEAFGCFTHIWGAGFMENSCPHGTSPQGKVLIHKKSRVIHIWDAWRRKMGEYPSAKYGGYF